MAKTKKAKRDLSEIEVLEPIQVEQASPVEKFPEMEQVNGQSEYIEADLEEMEELPNSSDQTEEIIVEQPKSVKNGTIILITRDGCIVKNDESGNNERLYGMSYRTLKVGDKLTY